MTKTELAELDQSIISFRIGEIEGVGRVNYITTREQFQIIYERAAPGVALESTTIDLTDEMIEHITDEAGQLALDSD